VDARKVILDAVHTARGILIHHVQTKQGREPEKTIDELRDTLESTPVNKAVRKLSD
jgi:hypothetical protein